MLGEIFGKEEVIVCSVENVVDGVFLISGVPSLLSMSGEVACPLLDVLE
jgi:hypothetical protein